MVSQRQQIIDEIQALGLSNSKLVLDSLRPAIRVIASKIDINDQEIGSSRFALIPDLPDSIEWPSWSVPETNCSFEQYIKNRPSPIPLDFIAQINMADLQSFEA
ncbi:MAG: DUF1963 domain-containing protein, partial [Cyanobacteria bacterium SZAS LIN-2]|nr:DUF1963 domain-containing protein [Cyanobacteria bacterium SZAS LIN-2]